MTVERYMAVEDTPHVLMVDGFCNSERRVLPICHLPVDTDQLDTDTFRHIVKHCLLIVVSDRPVVRRPKVQGFSRCPRTYLRGTASACLLVASGAVWTSAI